MLAAWATEAPKTVSANETEAVLGASAVGQRTGYQDAGGERDVFIF